ncbi:MAG: PEGA domain-containing protein [Deltaproteobacteria bacterium]|nr:PEGA domain-containing protein [Deltaproteobacteria bacterium]
MAKARSRFQDARLFAVVGGIWTLSSVVAANPVRAENGGSSADELPADRSTADGSTADRSTADRSTANEAMADERGESPSSDTAQAKVLFEAASRAYRKGQYEMAVAGFEEAYRLAPRPQVAFSAAQAYRKKFYIDGDRTSLERAIALYQAYLIGDPNGRRRDHAAQHIASLSQVLLRLGVSAPGATRRGRDPKTQIMISSDLGQEEAMAIIDGAPPVDLPAIVDVKPGRHALTITAPGYFDKSLDVLAVDGRLVGVDAVLTPKPALLRISAPDDAEVSIDGRLQGTTPFSNPIEVPEGEHFIAVTQSGAYPFVEEMTLKKGDERTIIVSLETTTQRTVSYVFLGTGAALFAGSTLFGLNALGHQKKAKDIERVLDGGRSLTVAQVETFQDAENKRDEAVAAASVLGAAAVVAGATGILMYVLDRPRTPAPRTTDGPALAIAPTAGASFAGLLVTGQY